MIQYRFDNLAQQVQKRFAPSNGSQPDLEPLYRQVEKVLSQARASGEMDGIARQVVEYVGADRILPRCHAKFQPLVTEGMIFLLTHLPEKRLTRKIADMLMLPVETSSGDRVCTLINDMPSLQKLGQVICRTQGLDPALKRALTRLENEVDTLTFEDLRVAIGKETDTPNGSHRFTVDAEILAEASVSAVVGAELYNSNKQPSQNVVLKMIKPKVRRHLGAELELLTRLAHFLERNKTQWGLGDFRFTDTFDQVSWLLTNEINLTNEQTNLKTAGRYYARSGKLSIPDRLSCSTPEMTVMTRVEGHKITDVEHLDAEKRRLLAAALAETCILRPVKDLGGATIFHGDPHAGNIAYTFEKGTPRLIFYDWGMLGRLNRRERYGIALMTMGVVAKSPRMVRLAAQLAAADKTSLEDARKADAHRAVKKILDQRRTWIGRLQDDINAVIGALSYNGAVFPTNLLMFQKAMITLKGVITDIDPGFNDDQLLWLALGSQMRDLCRPRYHWKVYNELMALGRYSTLQLMQFQWMLFNVSVELGLAGLYLTLPGGRFGNPKFQIINDQ